jgi:hypothetical protein
MLERNWATDDLVRLDALEPGLISRVMTCSPATRHAILMVLAHRYGQQQKCEPGADDDDARLAKVLRRERGREIIHYGFGTVPQDGLMGALNRLSDSPMLSAHAYGRLHALFQREGDRRKVEAIERVGQPITEQMLRVLDALDPRWVHAHTLTRIESYGDAIALNRALAFAQSAGGATDEAIADTIARLQPTSTLPRLVERFVHRVRPECFPPHPIEADEADIHRLVSVRDFILAGRVHRNCLAKKMPEALVGGAAYAVFQSKVIWELRPLSNEFGWVLFEVFVAGNKPVPSDLKRASEAKAGSLGIPVVDMEAGAARLSHYRRFVMPNHWEWAG